MCLYFFNHSEDYNIHILTISLIFHFFAFNSIYVTTWFTHFPLLLIFPCKGSKFNSQRPKTSRLHFLIVAYMIYKISQPANYTSCLFSKISRLYNLVFSLYPSSSPPCLIFKHTINRLFIFSIFF